jgi:hypothetical protein
MKHLRDLFGGAQSDLRNRGTRSILRGQSKIGKAIAYSLTRGGAAYGLNPKSLQGNTRTGTGVETKAFGQRRR